MATQAGHPDGPPLPHIASGTRETRQAMADLSLDNLQSFFATGRVLAPAPSAG